MRPAWSIILFTVLSGSGLGTAMVLPVVAAGLSVTALFITAALAVILFVVGLLSSTGHLANPKNAWRSLFRLRTSWLSREAALALLFFPIFAGWLLAAWSRHPSSLWLAVLVIITAIATVFCTAMIYASLKTVPLWRHPLTPVNYLLLATLSGLLLLTVVCRVDTGEVAMPLQLSLLLAVIFAGLGKVLHFGIVRKMPTVGDATALSAGRVRLLEAGHTAPNFLTREFVYQPDAAHVRYGRWLMWGLMFAVPLLTFLLLTVKPTWSALWFVVSPLFFVGLLAERWLFFAEARHVVRLYYGD